MHYHRDLLAICDTYGTRVLQPARDDLFCGSPPLAFTFGLGGLLLFPLYAGAATVLLEKAGPLELLEAIVRVWRDDDLHRADRLSNDARCDRSLRYFDVARVRLGG